MSNDGELVDSIVADDCARNRLDAAQMASMLNFVDHARDAGTRIGGESAGRLEASAAAHELSLALMAPVATIETQLACARRIRSLFPSVWAAWARGDVTTLKVVKIDQAAGRLTRPQSRVVLDEAVVDVAIRKTAGQLKAWLDRLVERLEAESAPKRHERAQGDRRVWFAPAGDGMTWMTALIPSLSAVAIDQRLESEVRLLSATDPRTHEQARADLLCELLLGDVDNGDGKRGGPSTTIGVIVPIQPLMGLSDQPGEMIDRSASVPAALIRAKAIEPGTLFWRLLTDQRGKLLDATYVGHHPPDKLGQAIRFRDGTSVFPSARVPAHRCDLDHTIAYGPPPRGGSTNATNLGPLHRRAHNLKTAGLMNLRQPEPGVFEWTTRTDHKYRHTADELPTAEWALQSAFSPEFVAAMETAVQAHLPPEASAA